MNDLSSKIKEILSRPIKTPTPEEGRQALIDCGVMDENGNIKEAYKDIIVPKGAKKNAKP